VKRRNFLNTLAGGVLLPFALPLLAQTAPPAKPAAKAAVPAAPAAVPPPMQPDLMGIDDTGHAIKLADYNGKALLVSFFTSGCNLCINDLKLMREFNRDNRAKSFVMLAISLDEQRSDYMEYAKLIALAVPASDRFPLLWRKAPEHRDTFGAVGAMPTHFVLDKSHKVAFTRRGSFKPDDWDELWTLLG
jgi:peroxiredoxin